MKGLLKMTIEHMKNIAKEKMNKEIAFLFDKLTTGSEVRATLFAFFLVDLFSIDEYRYYLELIRQAEKF